MNDLQVLLEQMMTDISSQASQLDFVRLGLFLGWLAAHSARVKGDMGSVQMNADMPRMGDMEERLKPALKTWFESLSAQGMLWEYRLILDEIAWWRELEPLRLHMLLKSEAGRRDG